MAAYENQREPREVSSHLRRAARGGGETCSSFRLVRVRVRVRVSSVWLGRGAARREHGNYTRTFRTHALFFSGGRACLETARRGWQTREKCVTQATGSVEPTVALQGAENGARVRTIAHALVCDGTRS